MTVGLRLLGIVGRGCVCLDWEELYIFALWEPEGMRNGGRGFLYTTSVCWRVGGVIRYVISQTIMGISIMKPIYVAPE